MKPLPAVLAVLIYLPNAPAADPIDYTRDVKPILTKNCITCHGAVKQRSGLRLDTAKAAFEGGNSGPVIVAGKSAASRIIHAVTGTHDAPKMPPKGPRLDASQIALLKRWIDEGARAPASETVQTTTNPKGKHWSFQPIKRPALPAVKDEQWV